MDDHEKSDKLGGSTILQTSLSNTNKVLHSNDRDGEDIFRDTPVRYLGYANEVGESFRSLWHVNFVRLSYVVASGYVCADAYHKGYQTSELAFPDSKTQMTHVMHAVMDTLIWQGLASVAIPGFTINRICHLSNYLLGASTKLPPNVRKWTTTAIGLGCIPLIIKPIDRSVDYMMNNTVRRWYHIDKVEEELVHHTRDK